MAQMKDQAITFNLEQATKAKLEKLASKEDRSVAYIIRAAIEKYLSETKAAA